MKYVMITHWDNHWDNLRDNRTKFTKSMYRLNMDDHKFAEGTETIFIKRDKDSKQVQKCWIGKVYSFKEGIYRDLDAVYFSVKIEKEIECPIEYLERSEGWYAEDAVVHMQQNISARNNVITEDHIKKITVKDAFQMLGQLSLGAFSLIIGFVITLLLIAYKIGCWSVTHK